MKGGADAHSGYPHYIAVVGDFEAV